jgi:hypothetical protein
VNYKVLSVDDFTDPAKRRVVSHPRSSPSPTPRRPRHMQTQRAAGAAEPLSNRAWTCRPRCTHACYNSPGRLRSLRSDTCRHTERRRTASACARRVGDILRYSASTRQLKRFSSRSRSASRAAFGTTVTTIVMAVEDCAACSRWGTGAGPPAATARAVTGDARSLEGAPARPLCDRMWRRRKEEVVRGGTDELGLGETKMNSTVQLNTCKPNGGRARVSARKRATRDGGECRGDSR